MPKISSNYICLVVIFIDFALKKTKNHYPQVFLKERVYIYKDIKVIRHFTDDLEISSDDSDKENTNK